MASKRWISPKRNPLHKLGVFNPLILESSVVIHNLRVIRFNSQKFSVYLNVLCGS